jgi:hypothetical protein
MPHHASATNSSTLAHSKHIRHARQFWRHDANLGAPFEQHIMLNRIPALLDQIASRSIHDVGELMGGVRTFIMPAMATHSLYSLARQAASPRSVIFAKAS